MPVLIFGDVHGEAGALRNLLARAREVAGTEDIEVFSVGDLIDRGPDAKGVIQTCIDEGVKLVLGNHELWLHRWFSEGVFDALALNGIMGGVATFQSYDPYFAPSLGTPGPEVLAVLKGIPDAHRDYILSGLPYRVIEIGGTVYRLTHGGVPDGLGELLIKDIKDHDGVPDEATACDLLIPAVMEINPSAILWGGAKKGRVFQFPDGSVQVFGHTPWGKEADLSPERGYIALDTGCGTCPPRTLSGVLLTEDGDRRIVTSR
jgi:hypothetical protein